MDPAMALVQFDRLMSEQAVVPHYQPVVDIRSEAMLASRFSRARTWWPGDAGGDVFAGGEAQRGDATEPHDPLQVGGRDLELRPPPHLFLNTHPAELHEPDWPNRWPRCGRPVPAAADAGDPREAASDVAAMGTLQAALRRSAWAGLRRLRLSQPDSWSCQDSPRLPQVRTCPWCGTSTRPRAARLMLPRWSHGPRDGIVPLAEGIECREERDVAWKWLRAGPGFYFGRPVALRSIG